MPTVSRGAKGGCLGVSDGEIQLLCLRNDGGPATSRKLLALPKAFGRRIAKEGWLAVRTDRRRPERLLFEEATV